MDRFASRVTRRDRRKIRTVARDAWIKCGPGEDAICCVKDDIRLTGIDPALLLVLLQIALKLMEWWMQHNVTEPSTVPMADEPIDWESPAEGENDAD